MPRAVIENWDQFTAFLAAQPLCQWSAKKQHEVAMGLHNDSSGGRVAAPKDDNADLMAALSSMA